MKQEVASELVSRVGEAIRSDVIAWIGREQSLEPTDRRRHRRTPRPGALHPAGRHRGAAGRPRVRGQAPEGEGEDRRVGRRDPEGGLLDRPRRRRRGVAVAADRGRIPREGSGDTPNTA